MTHDETINLYLRTTNWIRREMRKAIALPAKQMIPRVEHLLNRSKSLSREVSKFLNQHDA